MNINAVQRVKKKHSGTRKDVIAGGIMIAAMILFVGTGGSVLSDFVLKLQGVGDTDNVMVSALLLNIALIIFGWRRYRELMAEMGERMAAEDRANELAVTDPLTGLANRRAVTERAAEMLLSARKQNLQIAFLMLDLDEFKRINDLYGHDAGDAVLKEVAARMKTVAPDDALLARLGGDEFGCAILFDGADMKSVEQLAGQLVEAMAQPARHDSMELDTTSSVGISWSESGSESVEILMRRADIAMYVAKRLGKDRFAWFEPGMEEELRTRNEVELAMRRGIPLGEFIPYFEPQIDLASGELIGFEMLARWMHDGLVVEPDTFILIAEETALIESLSFSIMEQAFVEAREWPAHISLSVNISPVQLRDPWLAQKLVKLLTETGFPAKRLEVEITESSLFDNLALAQTIVASLKNQGIRVALDDFGTGYSSLAHLRALPFDRIKIDKSFVMSLSESNDSVAIVKAIIGLGESLGLPVTAEGIEFASVAETVREMGAHRGQGYGYGRPVGALGARKLLGEHGMPIVTAAQRETTAPTASDQTPDDEAPRRIAG